MFIDIFNSLLRNFHARIKSPIIGAFIASWVVFNWTKIALLLWGSRSFDERIQAFNASIEANITQSIYYPGALAFVFIFGLPVVNFLVQKSTKVIELARYETSVNIKIDKQQKLREFNKEQYKSEPKNGYIKKEIDIEFESKLESKKLLEQQRLSVELKNKTLENEKKASEEKFKIEEAKRKEMDLANVQKERVDEKEKERRKVEKQKNKSIMSSFRFPAAYEVLKNLSNMLDKDGYRLSLNAMTQIITNLFGFSSFEELLKDKKFNTKNLLDTEYLVYDSEILINKFNLILENDNVDDLEGVELIDYIQKSLDHYSFKLIREDDIADHIREEIDINENIVMDDGLAGPIADTNAYFMEDPILAVDGFGFTDEHNKFYVDLSGSCKGKNHEDKMFYGNTLAVNVTAHLG